MPEAAWICQCGRQNLAKHKWCGQCYQLRDSTSAQEAKPSRSLSRKRRERKVQQALQQDAGSLLPPWHHFKGKGGKSSGKGQGQEGASATGSASLSTSYSGVQQSQAAAAPVASHSTSSASTETSRASIMAELMQMVKDKGQLTEDDLQMVFKKPAAKESTKLLHKEVANHGKALRKVESMEQQLAAADQAWTTWMATMEAQYNAQHKKFQDDRQAMQLALQEARTEELRLRYQLGELTSKSNPPRGSCPARTTPVEEVSSGDEKEDKEMEEQEEVKTETRSPADSEELQEDDQKAATGQVPAPHTPVAATSGVSSSPTTRFVAKQELTAKTMTVNFQSARAQLQQQQKEDQRRAREQAQAQKRDAAEKDGAGAVAPFGLA